MYFFINKNNCILLSHSGGHVWHATPVSYPYKSQTDLIQNSFCSSPLSVQLVLLSCYWSIQLNMSSHKNHENVAQVSHSYYFNFYLSPFSVPHMHYGLIGVEAVCHGWVICGADRCDNWLFRQWYLLSHYRVVMNYT